MIRLCPRIWHMRPRRREGFANLFHGEPFVEIKERERLVALLELAYGVDELGSQLRGHLAARILVEEVAVLGGLEPRLIGYLGLCRRTPKLTHQPARGLLYLPARPEARRGSRSCLLSSSRMARRILEFSRSLRNS
jgi:hypothetical protein